MEREKALRLRLYVSGMHLSPMFGMTVRSIEKDGFAIAARIRTPVGSDTPGGISKAIGNGIVGFSRLFAKESPDVLVVLGDRYEMFAAATAAMPFNIPMAHVHGGESTTGLIDEAIRHSITKMSHLHFVSTERYRRRVIQMGEAPWRVMVSGAPGIDNLHSMTLLERPELERRLGLTLRPPTILVTYHPVTLEYSQTQFQMTELLNALKTIKAQVIFTYPNADTASHLIIRMIRVFSKAHRNTSVFANLGTLTYFSLMKQVSAMGGNSSSGIIEAASFKLPVVNIGNRQGGRIHDKNVIDVGYSRQSITRGIRKAISSRFKNSLKDLKNPYGSGHAAQKIIQRLKTVRLDERLLQKEFHDVGF